MTTKRHTKASNLGDSAAKRRHRLEDEASQARSLPVKPSTEVLMLLQSPRKRTPKHLEVARLRLIDNASAINIAGDYVPRDVYTGLLFYTKLYRCLCVKDRDQAFERAVAFFCQPSREKLVRGPNIPDSAPFSCLFAHFDPVLLRKDVSKHLFGLSSFLAGLMATILGFEAAEDLRKDMLQYSRFISSGILRTHGAYVKFCEGRSISIPLIVFSVITMPKTDDRETPARYEVLQALLQAILAYSHNQQLDNILDL